MVPLESLVKEKRTRNDEPRFVSRRAVRDPEPDISEPRAPRRFRIVDVMTRRALVDDGSARAAVDALKSVRSIVDVDVYAWNDERDRWQRLTFAEQRAMMVLAREAA
jgi:hypothetical protein